MAFEKILVLDDEVSVRKALEEQLRRSGYGVTSAACLADAEALLAKEQFDLIFADLRLPDGDGARLIDTCNRLPDGPVVVIITGYGSIESAVECMRQGAFHYVVKPFSRQEIDVILEKSESYSQLVKVNRYFNDAALEKSEILGNSLPLRQLRALIQKVALRNASVLICGENGTGKELIANEIYRISPRAGHPFIKVNCAAVPDNLIESEFFGHEKGAFTGATQRREGRFELADGGVILLDEVGEIPLPLQSKLLRVLQEREFERVGGNKTLKVNVRVLATTNRDLLRAVRNGDFREDLFYRLNVFPILAPPLRELREDIPLLSENFLKSFCRKHGVSLPGFTPAAMRLLGSHDWPGNVRELQNVIERAVILSENGRAVGPEMLGLIGQDADGGSAAARPRPAAVHQVPPPPVNAPAAAPKPPDAANEEGKNFPSMDELEKQHIFRALKRTGGRRAKAAGLLGISVRTLRNKLKLYRENGAGG